MRSLVVVAAMVALGSEAWAGDKGACRKARRERTIDGWAGYVLGHPDGVCRDEALGQMIVLGVGRVAAGMSGDPTTLALTMAQLGRLSDADFQGIRELMGGLGGLGGLGGGLGALGGLGGGLGAGGLGGLGAFDPGGALGEVPMLEGVLGDSDLGVMFGTSGLGTEGSEDGSDEIYVGFSVISTAGDWNHDAFALALEDVRAGLQACWSSKGLPLVAVSYDVGFEVAAGRAAVTRAAVTAAADGAPNAEVEACLRQELGALAIPEGYAGSYTYRVDFY